MPVVSVVIPTFNYAHFLPEVLSSVLAQTFTDMEVLVVDDGSTDNTRAVLQNLGSPIRLISQANQGVSQARNRGIAESRGRYVAFLDADDLWEPAKLARQLAALAERTEARACFTARLEVSSNLTPLGVHRIEEPPSWLGALLIEGNVVGTPSSVLAERSLFDEVGGFDPCLSQCADWDMWVRLAGVTTFAYLDEPLIRYRRHAASMSRQVQLLEHDSLRVLEKGFSQAGVPDSLRARRCQAFAHNYTVLAGCYFHARQPAAFLRCAAQAMRFDIRQLGYLAGFPARLWRRTPRGQIR